jgi:hypothetical protein
MTDFKDTLAKFTYTLSFQEKGKFPSQPQQNPKGNTMQIQVVLEANTRSSKISDHSSQW